jgi:molybdenum cofactor cytidylyltransferase
LVGTTRLPFRARRRAEDSLRERVGWYASTLSTEWTSPTPDALLTAFSRARAESDLVLVATAASMDPGDVVFDALRAAGGTVERVGIPIEPGTACWVGRLGTRSVFGLASCELFGSPGAFDLLLPRLLLGEHPDAAMLTNLARGGLLLDGPSIIPDYLAAAEEAAA